MIKEDKNKLRIKTRSKILVLGLILIILVGLFGPIKKTHAVGGTIGTCTLPNGTTAQLDSFDCVDTNKGTWKTLDGKDPSIFEPATPNQDLDLGCSIGLIGSMNLKGCVAEFFYIIWVASSWVAEVGGRFLDFFVYYSTNSSSYTNEFISKGWGAVRDVANIFFIVTLLYIAIKTVLSLDSHGSKKMISYVVIIALVINFSLFTTKVVIDASNILAKIFYNNMTSVDANNKPLDAKAGGEKSISVGIIQKFNPQKLVTKQTYTISPYSFIFLTILLIVITLYTAYVFFAIAVLFVARVVSLWIAMIFSPLAFISYAVPFDVPFGHKEWWDDLLKNAFLAPIFIFFLYIIVLFTGFLDKIISYTDSPNLTTEANIMQSVMSVVIPFAILMMLLMKAKSLVVKYSGKIGEAVMSGAKMVGGFAIGAATGGAALLATNTIGKRAQGIASDDNLKAQAAGDKEHFARMGITDIDTQQKMQKATQKKLASANKTASRSFDLRDTGIGKFASKKTGLNFNEGTSAIGVDTEKLKGGRQKQIEHQIEKEQKKEKTYLMSGAAAVERDNLANKRDERVKQYEADKKAARDGGALFTDADFKRDYEAGNNLGPKYKLFKTVEAGSVDKIKTSKEENAGRKAAYEASLENNASKEAAKGIVKTFGNEFYTDMKKMYSTAGGLAATAAIGAATGGIGLVAAPLAYSLAHAIKTTLAKKVIGDVRSTNAEVIAGVRKTKTKDEQLLDILKEKNAEDKKKEEAAHPTPAPTPTAAAHPPAGDGHGHA